MSPRSGFSAVVQATVGFHENEVSILFCDPALRPGSIRIHNTPSSHKDGKKMKEDKVDRNILQNILQSRLEHVISLIYIYMCVCVCNYI